MLRPSSRRSNSNRPAKPGPFAWVRRLGVFRAIAEGSSHQKRRDRARDKRQRTPSLLSADRPSRTDLARDASPEPAHSNSNGQHPFPAEHRRPGEPARAGAAPADGPAQSAPHTAGSAEPSTPRHPKSRTPTIGTADFASDGRVSRAGTTGTGLGTVSITEGNSIFSLPNRSSQSLATTLTTIRSSATPNMLAQDGPAAANGRVTYQLPRSLNPPTYSSMTANNMLTDNASMLTLASSRRHRRNSFDTNASVRAIPPASLFNTSRESLQLPAAVHLVDGATHATGGSSALGPGQYATLRFPIQSDPPVSLRGAPIVSHSG